MGRLATSFETWVDSNNFGGVSLGTSLAGEDLANDVLKTENRNSYNNATADALIKTGVGLLHSITFSCNDAAPTAGTIDVYDNTTNSGSKIFSWTLTTAVFSPVTIILDVAFTTGLYIDFTTTADVNAVVSYR